MVKSANTGTLKVPDESLVGSSPTESTNIAWAAGLFEGEGSVYPVNQKRYGKEYHYVRMCLKMTDEDVVDRFHAIVKVGSVTFVPREKPHYKDAWLWQLNNREQCSDLIDKLWPYLGNRRRNRVMELNL